MVLAVEVAGELREVISDRHEAAGAPTAMP